MPRFLCLHDVLSVVNRCVVLTVAVLYNLQVRFCDRSNIYTYCGKYLYSVLHHRLTLEWFGELSFSRLECGVHDRLHISSADWWDLLLPLA